MDMRSNFIQATFIPLLVLLTKITSELFRCYKHLKTQFFFAYLLTLLAGFPCFCLLISITIGLVIGKAELIGKKVAICFFKYFL